MIFLFFCLSNQIQSSPLLENKKLMNIAQSFSHSFSLPLQNLYYYVTFAILGGRLTCFWSNWKRACHLVGKKQKNKKQFDHLEVSSLLDHSCQIWTERRLFFSPKRLLKQSEHLVKCQQTITKRMFFLVSKSRAVAWLYINQCWFLTPTECCVNIVNWERCLVIFLYMNGPFFLFLILCV